MKLQLCLIFLFTWYPGLLPPFQVIFQNWGSSTLPLPVRTNFWLIFAWTTLSSPKSIKHSSSSQNLLKLSTKSKAWNGGWKYYYLSLIIRVVKRRWARSLSNFSLPLLYHCFMLLPEKFSSYDAHVIASNASTFLDTILNQLNILTAGAPFFVL